MVDLTYVRGGDYSNTFCLESEKNYKEYHKFPFLQVTKQTLNFSNFFEKWTWNKVNFLLSYFYFTKSFLQRTNVLLPYLQIAVKYSLLSLFIV